MAIGRDVVLRITANVTSLRAGMLSAAASVKDFEGQVVQVAKVSNETQRIAGQAMLGVGVAAAAGLALAVRSAVQFEQRMANVATISSDVQKDFGGAGDAILEMSGRLGIGANELAEGLYDVASAGFQGAEGMRIVEVAGIAAQAGLSSTAVAAKAITGAMNAYGLTVANVSDISDIFFQTVNLGIITFEELAQNVGDFMGTANALGIALDVASAGLATITLAGVPASEAATSLNAVMTQMLSPSKELSATLAALGFESGQAAIDSLGLVGTLLKLKDVTGEDKAAFAALFPEIRSMRGALALTAQDGATYNRVAGEITDKNKRAGAAAEALAIQQKSLGAQLKIAKEQIGSLAIGIGQSLLPVLKSLVGLVQNVTTGFAALGGGAQGWAAGLGILGVGVLTIGGGLLLLAPKIAAAVKWFQLLRVEAPLLAGAISKMTLAMGAIGIALVAATFVLASYGAAKRDAKERTDEFVEALRAEKAGVEDAMEVAVAKTIADKELGTIAMGMGITMKTLTDAMLGNEDAYARVTAAAQAYITSMTGKGLNEAEAAAVVNAQNLLTALKANNVGLVDSRLKIQEEDRALEAMGVTSGKAAGQLGGVGDAALGVAGGIGEADEATKAFTKSLVNAADVGKVYSSALTTMQNADKDAATAAGDTMKKRHAAEQKALDNETVTGKASKAAHDQRVKDLEARQDAETDAADATEKNTGRTRLSMEEYRLAVEKNTKSTLAWMRNLAVISARGGTGLRDQLAALGPEAAALVEDVAKSSESSFGKFKTTMGAGSEAAITAAQAQFALLPSAIGKIGELSGTSFAQGLLTKFSTGVLPITDILDRIRRLANEMIPVPGMPGAFRPRGGGATATLNAEGHVAQIAPAGSWRIWAEPETGGEAYIPLGASKRGRSMALLAQVAGQFGHAVVPMAAGGTWGVSAYVADRSAAAAGMSGGDMARLIGALEKNAKLRPAQMQNVFPPGIDPVHVAQKIAWRLRP